MKILFIGDSITDADRSKERQGQVYQGGSQGVGYVYAIASELCGRNPDKYQIINTGINGHRSVDIYARIKKDCWNYQPDVLSILVGVNDVWTELKHTNGVELDRYEKVYRMIIEDTLKTLPNVKIMILGSFIQMGSATEEHFEDFLIVKEYAKVAKKLADEYGLTYIPLQESIDAYAEKFGCQRTLGDGIHPTLCGARVIADEWLKVFREKIDR